MITHALCSSHRPRVSLARVFTCAWKSGAPPRQCAPREPAQTVSPDCVPGPRLRQTLQKGWGVVGWVQLWPEGRCPHTPVLRLVIHVSLHPFPSTLSASFSARHSPAATTASGDLRRRRLLTGSRLRGRLRRGGLCAGAGGSAPGRRLAPTGRCRGGCHRRCVRHGRFCWWWWRQRRNFHLHNRLGSRPRPSRRPGAQSTRVSQPATHMSKGWTHPGCPCCALSARRPDCRFAATSTAPVCSDAAAAVAAAAAADSAAAAAHLASASAILWAASAARASASCSRAVMLS